VRNEGLWVGFPTALHGRVKERTAEGSAKEWSSTVWFFTPIFY